jgi:hypothetical protein
MNDQYEGQGGSYIINSESARELVSRTEEAPPPDPEIPILTEEIAPPSRPAKAGFFTPVAPVVSDDATTTTE